MVRFASDPSAVTKFGMCGGEKTLQDLLGDLVAQPGAWITLEKSIVCMSAPMSHARESMQSRNRKLDFQHRFMCTSLTKTHPTTDIYPRWRG